MKPLSGAVLCAVLALASSPLFAADYTSAAGYRLNNGNSFTSSDDSVSSADYEGVTNLVTDNQHSTGAYDTFGTDLGTQRLAYATASGLGVYRVAAIQTILDTYTNTTSSAVNATVDLSLLGSLMYGSPSAKNTDTSTSSVTYSLLRDGVSIWNTSAALTSLNLATTLSQTGGALDYVADTSSSFSLYTLDQQLQIALGTIAAGQTVNLTYTITSVAAANIVGTFSSGSADSCAAGAINFGCPGGSSSDGEIFIDQITTSAVPVAAVPEASQQALWLAGLCAMSFALWRRKNAASNQAASMKKAFVAA